MTNKGREYITGEILMGAILTKVIYFFQINKENPETLYLRVLMLAQVP